MRYDFIILAFIFVAASISAGPTAAQDRSTGPDAAASVQEAKRRGYEADSQNDYAKALSWFRKAADDGDAEAQYNVGTFYEQGGKGVTQDYSRAVGSYLRAANQGYAPAQASLGGLYISGRGVPQDIPAGARLVRKAADSGYATAQKALGLMYENGVGVPQSTGDAIRWFRKAAEQGDAEAQRNLQRLQQSAVAPVSPSAGPSRIDIKGITLDMSAKDIPDMFCEQRAVDHVMQEYCGVRRFDGDNERMRIYVARHFSNRIYRIELFFKQTENLDRRTRLGAELLNKYGVNIKEFNTGMVKTIWTWTDTPSGIILGAICGLQDGVSGIGTCSIRLVNDQLEERERSSVVADKSRKAPAPPKF